MMDVRIVELPRRRVAVRRHDGDEGSVDEARRPLYQHLIMHEAVGGPSMLRFHPGGAIDVLVGTTDGFTGEGVADIEVLQQGWFAVVDFEGPVQELPDVRDRLMRWTREAGHHPGGPILQVHLMDAIDGMTEQQLQLPLVG